MAADDLLFLLTVLAGTLMISYWSARSRHDTDRFYAASRGLTGVQNGLAISGDFISAASFLGVSSTVARWGFDGFLYGASFFASYLLLWTVAESVHRLGRYTLADALDSHFRRSWLRFATAVNTLIISVAYLIPQLVAAGELAQSLLGWPRTWAVWWIGLLMTLYVAVGGMVSTSWVQIVKSVLLLSTAALMALIVGARTGWNPAHLWRAAVAPDGGALLAPGRLYDTAWASLSVNVPLVLGTMGMPHILVRFLTVRGPTEVRRSLTTATSALGLFYLLVLVLGFAAAAFGASGASAGSDGSLAVIVLARRLGGPFLAAFVSAVAFATVLAVVTGLLITATGALAHDLLHRTFAWPPGDHRDPLTLARVCAVLLGLVATMAALLVHGPSITALVSLVFVWAAATNVPVLLCTFYWRRFTAAGALAGMASGAGVTAGWLLLHACAKAGGVSPGLWAIGAGAAGCLAGSLLWPGRSHAQPEREPQADAAKPYPTPPVGDG
ncbi:solute symporter family protein [Alicyclobacillus macrosporangiidus]|uniref:Cation/acetate symporter n=1 Tax=Alicyclobacillus macrosporangiidus TaxID=392015 RepID=A0A1I7GZI0_9BACL|nr:cation acetate symporter [Alicyclobacillus macrosporangiidus]SFU53812.1 cation/acetate symporter [Alicyclobacillus macrosporangiidus]